MLQMLANLIRDAFWEPSPYWVNFIQDAFWEPPPYRVNLIQDAFGSLATSLVDFQSPG